MMITYCTLRRKWWATLKLCALLHRAMQRCFSRRSSLDSGGGGGAAWLALAAVPAAEESAMEEAALCVSWVLDGGRV